MKKGSVPAMLILSLIGFGIGGCDFFMGPDTPGGEGNLVVSLGADPGAAKFIDSGANLPGDVLAALRYELTLTGPDGEALKRNVSGGESFRMTAALGQWRVDARAYQQENVLAGTGSLTFTVGPGLNSVLVPMNMNGPCYEIVADSTMTGGAVTSSFSAAFPGTTVTITALPDSGHVLTPGTMAASRASDNTAAPDFAAVAPGVCTFTMPGDDVDLGAGFTQVAFTVASVADFTAALTAIQGGPADLGYTVTATADISLGPQDLTAPGYANKTIFLKGSDPSRIIGLSAAGSLFTVGQDLTLELENIVLQGTNANTAPLVTVDGGHLVMNNGAAITGNQVITSGSPVTVAGGVLIDNAGTFIMNDGEISNNTVTTHNVHDNTGVGGVQIKNASSFTLNGGEIKNNSFTAAPSYNVWAAGGVGIDGFFIMNNGKIINNTVTVSGPQCAIAGGLMGGGEIHGGLISENNATHTGSLGGAGGGVLVNGGNLLIDGGEISANTAAHAFSGGGIMILSGTYSSVTWTGTLRKLNTGGTIYGADAPTALQNTATSSGKAVAIGAWGSVSATRANSAGPADTMDSSVSGAPGGWD